jgi:hypothetical protein
MGTLHNAKFQVKSFIHLVQGIKWSLIYSSIKEKGDLDLGERNWNKYRFSLENLQSGEIFEGFRILEISNIA